MASETTTVPETSSVSTTEPMDATPTPAVTTTTKPVAAKAKPSSGGLTKAQKRVLRAGLAEVAKVADCIKQVLTGAAPKAKGAVTAGHVNGYNLFVKKITSDGGKFEKCGDLWKNLPNEEKKKYTDEAMKLNDAKKKDGASQRTLDGMLKKKSKDKKKSKKPKEEKKDKKRKSSKDKDKKHKAKKAKVEEKKEKDKKRKHSESTEEDDGSDDESGSSGSDTSSSSGDDVQAPSPPPAKKRLKKTIEVADVEAGQSGSDDDDDEDEDDEDSDGDLKGFVVSSESEESGSSSD